MVLLTLELSNYNKIPQLKTYEPVAMIIYNHRVWNGGIIPMQGAKDKYKHMPMLSWYLDL